MARMKKVLYTLCVDDYEPEICAITFPLLERYARKIDAEFHVIRDRKTPEYAPVLEKFQIYDLARDMEVDWAIYMDADTLVHPDFFDVTAVLHKSYTASNGSDFILHRWKADKYFLRDGRFIGKGNWIAFASDWCLDYWHPPFHETTYDEVVAQITPTVAEANTVIRPDHLVDDYLVSRNIARFGLKHVLIPDLMAQYKAEGPHLAHQYTIDTDKKILWMKEQVKAWGLSV